MLKHKAKKSLGQNFLTAPSVVTNIVRSGNVSDVDTVLEIGPGKGVLTKALLLSGATVMAIEKDDALYEYLQTEFSEYIKSNKLKLIHGDVLQILPTLILKDEYKLIANIPYNITGKIISDFLSRDHKPSCMVLMVQYEVAARIVGRQNKPSILSIAVEVYGKPKLIQRVSAGSFYPKPRVDSAVLLISEISGSFFKNNNIPEDIFFKTLKSGFAHKRKKLSSNLKEVFDEVDWNKVFIDLKLAPNTRAEEINKETWLDLSKINT
jgi:16S rRNA (adenine1518-N6/adenine1519-N6)-dimethyltransferase